MSLENGKCPNCGANIRVDTGQVSLFCQYCGSRFETKTAVTKHKVELSGKVNVDGGAGNDKIKSAANALQMAGKFSEAEYQWRRAIDIDPTDGEAYVGVCLCQMLRVRTGYGRMDDLRSILRNGDTNYLMAKQYAQRSQLVEVERLWAKARAEVAEMDRRNKQSAKVFRGIKAVGVAFVAFLITAFIISLVSPTINRNFVAAAGISGIVAALVAFAYYKLEGA